MATKPVRLIVVKSGNKFPGYDYVVITPEILAQIAAGIEIPGSTGQLKDLTGDATHRTVSDAEKLTWNGKQAAGSYVLTNDARLTDARDPKSHTHSNDHSHSNKNILDLIEAVPGAGGGLYWNNF